MFHNIKDILTAYRATEYVTDGDGTIGILDKTDNTAVWYRLHRGSFYYFDGRTSQETLNEPGNFRHKT